MSFCQQCGTKLTEGVRFCQNCGAPVGAEANQANQPHQPSQPHQPLQAHQAPPAWQHPAPPTAGWAGAPQSQGVNSGSKIALAVVGLAAIGIGGWQLVESGVFGGSSSSGTGNSMTTAATSWIVGRWAERPETCNTAGEYAEFHADGRFTTGTDEGRWTLAGEQLTLVDGPQPGTFTVRPVGSDGMSFDNDGLTRCGGAGGMSEGPGATDMSTGTGGPSGGLEAALAAGANALRQQLPMVNGPLTISRVEQSGTTLTVYGQLSNDVSAAEWAQLDQMMPGQQCQSLGHLIRRGATVTYSLTDAAYEQHDIRITSCPGGGAGTM